eukprot:CAMPEP_0195019088 /NCGR_PEP_ID=MMETSP0326_2-20130528/31989_1 /TAXON_ID=2866 ORGANISM="Crypthecodinium cohnii, Strain Seligo" /NCGR_SAMPLE_ID=MMETSP0326_2 /ASSEMBLY_ACC=CAM_ASM_000348 /LENGTH=76 /DNA_ID=CAMNT_0040036951 /DNA_START=1 /DNA_END=228 /DNA_ORIENTATION=+
MHREMMTHRAQVDLALRQDQLTRILSWQLPTFNINLTCIHTEQGILLKCLGDCLTLNEGLQPTSIGTMEKDAYALC